MDAVQRLQEILDAKDAEIEESNGKLERLERQLAGSLNGWRESEEWTDDGELPVPRLELVYRQLSGWGSYEVVYRLVMKHLCDQIVGVPLGRTKIDGSDREPIGLPFRDGAHAMHDSAHLQLPVYRLLPGKPPKLVKDDGDYAHQIKRGAEHRRPR